MSVRKLTVLGIPTTALTAAHLQFSPAPFFQRTMEALPHSPSSHLIVLPAYIVAEYASNGSEDFNCPQIQKQ